MLHYINTLLFSLITHDNAPTAITLLWLACLVFFGHEVYQRRRYLPVLGHAFFQDAPAIVYCRLTTTGAKPIYETHKPE